MVEIPDDVAKQHALWLRRLALTEKDDHAVLADLLDPPVNFRDQVAVLLAAHPDIDSIDADILSGAITVLVHDIISGMKITDPEKSSLAFRRNYNAVIDNILELVETR